MEGTYLLIMRGPVFRRHDSYPGFRTELENRVGDIKGKGSSGRTTRLGGGYFRQQFWLCQFPLEKSSSSGVPVEILARPSFKPGSGR